MYYWSNFIVFDSIDTNKNGRIEKSELRNAIAKFDPLISDQNLENFFKSMEEGDTESIGLLEFLQLMRKYLPGQEKSSYWCPVSHEESKNATCSIDVEAVPRIFQNEDEMFASPLQTNPIQFGSKNFITDAHRILESCVIKSPEESTETENKNQKGKRRFIRAGPRPKIAFDPSKVTAAIVTCGGLCPGENTVIREIVMCLKHIYDVSKIYGIRFGYEGFYAHEMMELTPKIVSSIHRNGGTILGSSRGGFDIDKILSSIEKNGINQIYIIGGDGTHRGAQVIYESCLKKNLKVSVACCPKTIDNDFQLIDRSFGFMTAVEEAQKAITSAKVEAEGFYNGVGLVKLMGRQSGHIALDSSLASRDVDYCLIPEVPFHLTSLLRHLKYSLHQKGNVVIVAAEGAGTHLGESGLKDKSGNPVLPDIGIFLKKAISEYFAKEGIEITIKYIDPTYMIRSVPPNANDSIYCSLLAHNAVHGAMAGFTGFTVGLINSRYVYIPIKAVTTFPKMVNPKGRKWFRLMESTRQPDFGNISNIFISLAEVVENGNPNK